MKACALALAHTVIYTSEKRGSDESGDGSRERPFKSVLQALRAADGKEPLPVIKVDAKAEGEVSLPLDERARRSGGGGLVASMHHTPTHSRPVHVYKCAMCT